MSEQRLGQWWGRTAVLVLLIVVHTASAEENLSLAAALARVDAVNERALIARSQLARAGTHVREVRAALKPHVSIDSSIANTAYTEDRFASSSRIIHGEAVLEQGLFDPKARHDLAGARSLRSEQSMSSDEARRELSFQTTEEYIECLSAEAGLNAAIRRQQLANTTLSNIQHRIDAGANAPNDQIRQDLEVASARLLALQAQQEQVDTHEALADLLCLSSLPPLSLPDPVVVPLGTIDELVAMALNSRKDIKAMRYHGAFLNEQQRSQSYAEWPRLEFRASAEGERGQPLYRYPLQSPWSVGLAATWSFYDGGESSARIEEFQYEEREYQLMEQAAIRTLRHDLVSGVSACTIAQAGIAQAQARLQLANVNLKDVETRSALGQATAVDLADAQSERYVAEREISRTQLQVFNAGMNVRRIIGWWPLRPDGP